MVLCGHGLPSAAAATSSGLGNADGTPALRGHCSQQVQQNTRPSYLCTRSVQHSCGSNAQACRRCHFHPSHACSPSKFQPPGRSPTSTHQPHHLPCSQGAMQQCSTSPLACTVLNQFNTPLLRYWPNPLLPLPAASSISTLLSPLSSTLPANPRTSHPLPCPYGTPCSSCLGLPPRRSQRKLRRPFPAPYLLPPIHLPHDPITCGSLPSPAPATAPAR